jgi:hypothetical protein
VNAARYRTRRRSDAFHVPYEREICYVGVKPCGCADAAILPRFAGRRGAARQVAGWMDKGWAIERVTLAEARNLVQPCQHHARPSRQLKLPGT